MAPTTIFGWFLGNLPSIESDPAAILGTYGDAGSILSQNALSLVATTSDGELNENTPGETLSYDAGAGPVTLQLEEMVSYGASVVTTDGVTRVVQFWAIQMTNGDVVLLHDMDPENDPFETTPIESVTLTHVLDTGYRMIPGYHSEPVAPACFCPGTLIATPAGARRVEALRIGQPVLTADRGAQPLRWIGVQRLRFDRPDDPHMPVEVKAGALGPDLPQRDLVLSPQHRILIADGPDEVLAPAKAFRVLPRVRQRRASRRAEYHCLLLDRHEVIFADGAAVESFLPGPMGLRGFGALDRLRIAAALPAARSAAPGRGPTARPVLGRRRAEALLRLLRARGVPVGLGRREAGAGLGAGATKSVSRGIDLSTPATAIR